MAASFAALLWTLPACGSTTPSQRLENRVALPVPEWTTTKPATTAPAGEEARQTTRLTPRSLIGLAFNRQPDIKSSYQAFKSEEARYDFFYASNDQLTPRISASNRFDESRMLDEGLGERLGQRDREHVIEFGVDKQFFDTTQMSIATGYETVTSGGDIGNQPYVSASLRYPLWESREKLERTSEDIFRQNELNDAQLSYMRQVRRRLENALSKFYFVVELRNRLESSQRWRDDLQALAVRLETITERNVAADRRRVLADLARASSEVRNLAGRYEIELARLKYSCGLPYQTEVKIDDTPFNPFAGATHEQLRRATIESDPEIATLRNSMRNAEVQLDLARRGKWDVALLLEGKSGLRGRGTRTGNTDWSVSAGLEVSAIDARVTSSLQRQARASILRFEHAIAARESLIYADTLEPLVRIETLSASRDELQENLPRFKEDYQSGLQEFMAGTLNIDDLLTRRENIFEQEEEIADLTSLVGFNVAELCAATGKFFELLDDGAPPETPES